MSKHAQASKQASKQKKERQKTQTQKIAIHKSLNLVFFFRVCVRSFISSVN